MKNKSKNINKKAKPNFSKKIRLVYTVPGKSNP